MKSFVPVYNSTVDTNARAVTGAVQLDQAVTGNGGLRAARALVRPLLVPLALFVGLSVGSSGCKRRSSAATGAPGGNNGAPGGSNGPDGGRGGAAAFGGAPGPGGTGGGAGAAAMGGSGGMSPEPGFCDDMPADLCGAVVAAQPALAGAPAVLWQSPIPYESLYDDAGVVVAGAQIAVPAGAAVVFFDRSGKLIAEWDDPMAARIAGAVADSTGNVYVIGSSLAAIDGSGAPLWQLHLRKDDPQSQISSPFVLSPDGTLYAALNDGRTVAITKDGNQLWDVTLPAAGLGQTARVRAGWDADLMITSAVAPFVVVDKRTGTVAKDVPPPATQVPAPSSTYPIAYLRGFGGVVATANGSVEQVQLHIVDADGTRRWSSRVQGWLSTDVRVTLDGRMLLFRPVSGHAQQGPWQAVRCGCQMQTTVAPLQSALAAGIPVFSLIGADGTIYVGVRDETTDPVHPAFELIAHDGDLHPLWRKTFPDQRFKSAPVIDDAGVLYMVGEKLTFDANGQWQQTYGQLVAVQTSSPGLARTANAARRYDSRQSGWSP